jgi:hypothetical protein
MFCATFLGLEHFASTFILVTIFSQQLERSNCFRRHHFDKSRPKRESSQRRRMSYDRKYFRPFHIFFPSPVAIITFFPLLLLGAIQIIQVISSSFTQKISLSFPIAIFG